MSLMLCALSIVTGLGPNVSRSDEASTDRRLDFDVARYIFQCAFKRKDNWTLIEPTPRALRRQTSLFINLIIRLPVFLRFVFGIGQMQDGDGNERILGTGPAIQFS